MEAQGKKMGDEKCAVTWFLELRKCHRFARYSFAFQQPFVWQHDAIVYGFHHTAYKSKKEAIVLTKLTVS